MSIERLTKQLSDLYGSYGYSHYTMSKFEEYDLYLRNKDFLVSDRILTFTDTDGKLMALKPDVTLSIIKNTAGATSGIQKLYYNENVYRSDKNGQGFREIMQVGLECMGTVDTYCILEVLLLAVRSLKTVSDSCVLDVSHLGLVTRLLDEAGLFGTDRLLVLDAIGSKNAHEIRSICDRTGVNSNKLAELSQLSGKPKKTLTLLENIFGDVPELDQLKQLLYTLEKLGVECVNVDFSVVNDMNYYNGIVFRGFVEGIPEGVLSGGQYDNLMSKMQRSGKAIGFALYPDLLERIVCKPEESVETILYYDDSADICTIASAIEKLTQGGKRILAEPYHKNINRGPYYRLVGDEIRYIQE